MQFDLKVLHQQQPWMLAVIVGKYVANQINAVE